MVRLLKIVSIILVAVTMGLSLAHALELPGKLRLDKEAYLAVQTIYYPGFTFGGFAEIGGMIAVAILLFLNRLGGARFWWIAAALVLLAAAHLTYWFVTHPVNNFWLKDVDLSGFGAIFFSLFAPDAGSDWTTLRDTWEYSHVARAVLQMSAFIALTVAVTAPQRVGTGFSPR